MYICKLSKTGNCKYVGNKRYNYGFVSGMANYCRMKKAWVSEIESCEVEHDKNINGKLNKIVPSADRFQCAACDGVFKKEWSHKEALKEKTDLFGDIPLEQCAEICDDCFNKMRNETMISKEAMDYMEEGFPPKLQPKDIVLCATQYSDGNHCPGAPIYQISHNRGLCKKCYRNWKEDSRSKKHKKKLKEQMVALLMYRIKKAKDGEELEMWNRWLELFGERT